MKNEGFGKKPANELTQTEKHLKAYETLQGQCRKLQKNKMFMGSFYEDSLLS